MAMRWKDIRQKTGEIFNEFKQHRVGIVGLGIIAVLIILGILAPVIAPNTNGQWNDSMRWRDNPKKAAPVWWDYFTSEKMAHHKIQKEPYNITKEKHQLASLATGMKNTSVKYTNITYKYNNQADLPPKDLITYIAGKHNNTYTIPPAHGGPKTIEFKPTVRISVYRPDGRTIELASAKVNANDTFGAGGEHMRFSLIKSRESKNTLYRFGQQFYYAHKYDKNEDISFKFNRTFDKSGNSVPANSSSWSISKEIMGPGGEEEGRPQIVSAYPGDGVEGFNVSEDPVVQFSEQLNPNTFAYTLENTSGPGPGDVNISWNWDNSKATFQTDNLSHGQTYRLSISQAEDLERNALGTYSFQFTTAERGVNDTTTPEITQVYPNPDSTIPRDQDITITFSEPMREETFDFNYSYDNEETKDGVHATWNDNSTVVTISHDSPVPQLIDIKPSEVLFGKTNDKILSFNPKPLKGDYYFNISIVGTGVELKHGGDSGRMIYAGRVFGMMGTDNRGRNIAKAWVWGARYALLLGGIVATTTVAIGTVYGMTSAYFGGWVDEIMQRINEIVIGIPLLPMLIIMMFIWKQSLWIMILLMCLLYWRGIAKTIRARGLQIKQSTFVEAAESLGAGGGRIIATHMIPQILPYSVAEAALIVPGVIVAEASLSVLGLGDPNIVTWGKLLSQANSAAATVQGLWWWVLLPGIGITIVGFAFIATGMAIEKVVQPKMKQR